MLFSSFQTFFQLYNMRFINSGKTMSGKLVPNFDVLLSFRAFFELSNFFNI